MSGKLLLEIGSEEIPARFLPDATRKLAINAERLFGESRISYKSIKVYCTPRRLALLMDGVAETQNSQQKEVWGPPLSVAFDSSGNPTKAALSFASNNNVAVKNLYRKEKGKGVYVVAIINEPVQSTESILPELLKKLVLSITFPKSMRWASGTIKYARPIHWILAMYNDKKVVFEIDNIKSSSMTRGHRFMSSAPFELKSISSYVTMLKNNFVIVDNAECKKIILEESTKLSASLGLKLKHDVTLLEHVSYLVEYPTPFVCSFDEKYLALPKELLITVMKDHQKYFALLNNDDTLSNKFIVVSNTRESNADNVIKGAEMVIKARFDDAKFYYEEDTKKSLKDRLKDLKKVVYHEKLGTINEKIVRIVNIASFIANISAPDIKEHIITAATICKSDLTCGVVREFPELQGIMGGYYALKEGYDPIVAEAISQHYLPTSSAGKFPDSIAGAILSIADKIDNIISFISIGFAPTATEDPYALKRQAVGIINILIAHSFNISIDDIVKYALSKVNRNDIYDEMMDFFTQRVQYALLSLNYTSDTIDSVIHIALYKPMFSIKLRLDALELFKKHQSFNVLTTAIKRVNNISSKHTANVVNVKYFTQSQEHELYKATLEIDTTVDENIKNNRFLDAINDAVRLQPYIDEFFDNVLVMHEDNDVRLNRLSLLNSVKSVFLKIADFSKLSNTN